MATRLTLTRSQVLGFRRRVGNLGERLPPGDASLRHAAWAGLQDSMPRAAVLSIHARVEDTGPTAWEEPSLVQLWGPRFSAFVVAERDIAPFTLGRLPDDPTAIAVADDLATRLENLLDGGTMAYRDAGRAMGVPPNRLRYAAPTGRVLLRWEGSGKPTVRTVPAPAVDPVDARLELARRFLHIYGPSTSSSFAGWAGIKPRSGADAFEMLGNDLLPVRSPVGDARILASDQETFLEAAAPMRGARLLPSGDAYTLHHGADRTMLVPDDAQRALLWTPRVWPGAILVDGEIVGTWRRSKHVVSLEPWRRLTVRQKDAVAQEALDLPLPEGTGDIVARWEA